jgi:hypothetical protein
MEEIKPVADIRIGPERGDRRVFQTGARPAASRKDEEKRYWLESRAGRGARLSSWKKIPRLVVKHLIRREQSQLRYSPFQAAAVRKKIASNTP